MFTLGQQESMRVIITMTALATAVVALPTWTTAQEAVPPTIELLPPGPAGLERSLERGGTILPPPVAGPPNCPIPTALSPTTELGDAVDTLRGLTGVYVLTEYLTEPPELKGKLRPQIRRVAEERLRAAGFRVLTRQEVDREPGKPRLEFYLTPGNAATGCPFRVSVSLRQEIVLVGAPAVHLLTGTWSDGGISDNGLAQGSELDTFSFYLDRFIDDWRTANSGEPRVRRRAEGGQVLRAKKTLGQKLDSVLSVSAAFTMPLSSGNGDSSDESTQSGRQGGEAPSSPILSTTLGLTWPDTGWFGRLTLYDYLIPSRQQPWNPDFAYSFGYDRTLSLTYSNYGGNRFYPEGGEEYTHFEQGSIRLGYELPIEDRLLAPLLTETMRILYCEPAITTNPTYLDEESDKLHNFKTSLSFGCRYPIWRDALYAGFTAFLYPFPDQQQEWDPDFIYSFGWSKGRPGTLSLDYSNYAGNRWPWHDDPGNGGFFKGAITLSYRLPLGQLTEWIGGSSLSRQSGR
jgi:hypothetical protein